MSFARAVILMLAALTLQCTPAPPPPRGVFHLLPLLRSAGADTARASHRSIAMPALVQHGGDTRTVTVRVPRDGRLIAWCAADADTGRAVRITLRARFGTQVLYEGAARRTWERIDADLARHVGRDVTLEFHAIGAAAAVFHWGAPMVAGPDADRLDAVLWLVDTLRQDALDAYGSPMRIAPAMSRFTREGTLFTDCLSTSSWTRPAMASVMTSRSALGHGVIAEDRRLPQGLKTLAESLSEAGWCTVAIITNANAGTVAGLDRGFDVVVDHSGVYDDFLRQANATERDHMRSSSSPSVTSELVFRYLQNWLPALPDMPLFLYVHVNDPHAPNNPRPPFDTIPGLRWTSFTVPGMPKVSERYGASVRSADWFFGRTLGLLEDRGMDRALIALVADHGEEFKEHGARGHGMNLHAETVRVPFALRCPGRVPEGLVVTERTSLMDIAPTILDLLSLPPMEAHEGSSLLAALRGARATSADRPFYLHVLEQGTRLDPKALADTTLQGELGVVRGRWKFLSRDYGDRDIPAATLLYDTESDPGELTSVATSRAGLADSLGTATLGWRDREQSDGATAEAAHTDDATRAQLEALGYLK